MTTLRRSIFILLLVCLGCIAQSTPPDVAHKIERQVRSFYTLPPSVNIKIGDITPSNEMPGYDAVLVTIEGGGEGGKSKDLKFLISKDRNSMMRVTRFDLNKDPFAELMGKINLTGRPSRGAKGAKVVVINYDDFECPFCSRMHQTLFPEILKEYGDRVEFFYKDYPLAEIHPWAIHAANDANCLADLNADAYWDFADTVHGNKAIIDNEKSPIGRTDMVDRFAQLQGQRHNVDVVKLQACIREQNDREVKASMREAEDLGVSATPTLFINGQKIDGAVPISEIRAALDSALKDAGQPVPAHTPSVSAPASK